MGAQATFLTTEPQAMLGSLRHATDREPRLGTDMTFSEHSPVERPPPPSPPHITGLLSLALLALSCVPAAAQQSQPIVEKTAHFSIDAEGEGGLLAAEAMELGVVLEQAWTAYVEVLKGEPVQKAPSQFALRLCADRVSWLAALAASGVTPPKELDALYFLPERNTLYLYRQPTRWLTRRLALHGTFQQMHYRAKSKHMDMVNTWFVLGLAEQLSNHRWDGKTLQLAPRLQISMTDLPGQAALVLKDSGGVGVFTEANLSKPAMSWALVSFLREGVAGKYRARFDKLALGQTGSKLSGQDFAATLGKTEEIYGEFENWLATVQEPLFAACGDWEDIDGREFVGRSTEKDYSFALVRAPCSEVEARFRRETDASAGLLIAFKDKQHYTFAAIDARGVVIKRCNGDEFRILGEYQGVPANKGVHRMRAVRKDGRVTVFVEDRETASFALEEERLGFAVEKGAACFIAVRWQ